MPKKYVCLDPYDSFSTSSESTAQQHTDNNPGHEVAEVDYDGEGDIETVRTTKTEIKK